MENKLPHLKIMIVTFGAVWLLSALTSSFVLETIIDLIDVYNRTVGQYGWYTFIAAVVISVLMLIGILVREVRK